MAAISNHLISTMASFLRWEPEQQQRMGGMTRLQLARLTRKLEARAASGKEMKRAAFRVFASLGANDEDIRKKIIDTEPLMDCVVTALDDCDASVQMAAIRCLHSLSRYSILFFTVFHFSLFLQICTAAQNYFSRPYCVGTFDENFILSECKGGVIGSCFFNSV